MVLGPALELHVDARCAPVGAVKGVGGWSRRRIPRVDVVVLALRLAVGVVGVDGRAVEIVAPVVVCCAIPAHQVEGELQLGAGGDRG